MAVVVYTSKPKELVAAIKKAIDDGHIDTWAYDSDGDFTHTPPQWNKLAWLRPVIASGVLHFGILGQKGVTMTKPVYGVYHGRFIEMLLNHFDNDFSSAAATAQQMSTVDNFK